jgi:hypothetical protein
MERDGGPPRPRLDLVTKEDIVSGRPAEAWKRQEDLRSGAGDRRPEVPAYRAEAAEPDRTRCPKMYAPAWVKAPTTEALTLGNGRRVTSAAASRVLANGRLDSGVLGGNGGTGRGGSRGRINSPMKQIKIVVEKHPTDMSPTRSASKEWSSARGDSYEEALADVGSALRFHGGDLRFRCSRSRPTGPGSLRRRSCGGRLLRALQGAGSFGVVRREDWRSSSETVRRTTATPAISMQNRTNLRRTRAKIQSEPAPPLPEDPTSYSDSCNSKLGLHVLAPEVHNFKREACN